MQILYCRSCIGTGDASTDSTLGESYCHWNEVVSLDRVILAQIAKSIHFYYYFTASLNGKALQ